jgi:hypothetical protein
MRFGIPSIRFVRRVPHLIAAAAIVAIVEGCGGGHGDHLERYKVEQSAQDALKQQGAKLDYRAYPQMTGSAWAVDLKGAQITDETIQNLDKIGYITEVNFSESTVTDAHLAKFKELNCGDGFLMKLDLSKTSVTDAGLAHMTDYLLIDDLNVQGTSITPEAIAEFKKNRQKANPNLKLFMKPLKVKQ